MSEEPLKVSLVSLGCPKNLVDSEKILGLLAEAGLVVGASMDDADVIIVNTCGFLEAARQESLDVIREALSHKAAGKVRRVVVAGCLVNRDAEKLYDACPGIDAIVGVNDRDAILCAVTDWSPVTLASPYGGAIHRDDGRFRLTPRHTGYLRISEGCSQKCTFCTIPAIRGPFRSKQPSQIIAEARELIADGAVELNVIGQDTTSYGMDITDTKNASLVPLMRELNALDGVQWLRLMYAYPMRFTDELIDTIAECEKIVPYIDLPLQHISDSVLKRMGRRVTRSEIETLLGKMRDRIEGLVLRTTFIVGFPGETDEDFAELLVFVKDFRFDALGVFAYSPEAGTPAARLPGAISDDIKIARAEEIMSAQQEIAFAANESCVGSPITVLVDGVNASGYGIGRYYGQAPDIDSVCILTHPREPGSFANGTVADWDGYDLIVKVDQD